MKYALNVKKGTTICHPRVGRLEGGKAYEISDEHANMLKNIMNIVVFDEVIYLPQENSLNIPKTK